MSRKILNTNVSRIVYLDGPSRRDRKGQHDGIAFFYRFQRIDGPWGNSFVHEFGDSIACGLRVRDARDVVGAFAAEEKGVAGPIGKGGNRFEPASGFSDSKSDSKS